MNGLVKRLSFLMCFVFCLAAAVVIVPTQNADALANWDVIQSEIGKNATGTEYLEDYGMSRDSIVSWLTSHLNDDYYLGSAYVGGDWQSPHGDTSYNGAEGENCAGFVAHVCRKSGLDCERVMKVMNKKGTAYGWGSGRKYDLMSAASSWYMLVENSNIRAYIYKSVDDMLKAGHAEKGDIVLRYVDKNYMDPGLDNHLAIYWGNGKTNEMWQCVAGGVTIRQMNATVERILLIKT